MSIHTLLFGWARTFFFLYCRRCLLYAVFYLVCVCVQHWVCKCFVCMMSVYKCVSDSVHCTVCHWNALAKWFQAADLQRSPTHRCNGMHISQRSRFWKQFQCYYYFMTSALSIPVWIKKTANRNKPKEHKKLFIASKKKKKSNEIDRTLKRKRETHSRTIDRDTFFYWRFGVTETHSVRRFIRFWQTRQLDADSLFLSRFT